MKSFNISLPRTMGVRSPIRTSRYSRHLRYSAVSVFTTRKCTSQLVSSWRSKKLLLSVWATMRQRATTMLWDWRARRFRPRISTICTVSPLSILISTMMIPAELPYECSSSAIWYKDFTYLTTCCAGGYLAWEKITGQYFTVKFQLFERMLPRLGLSEYSGVHLLFTPMEMKYICDIYNFWPQKYISASFKYMSSICQIYVRYILANIYIKYMWNIF